MSALAPSTHAPPAPPHGPVRPADAGARPVTRPVTRPLPAALAALDGLPVLDEARRQLLRALETPGTAEGRLADIVETDPGLTVLVLRAAAGPHAPGGVPAALGRLGPDRLRALAEAAPVHDPLSPQDTWRMPLEPFRQHAVATRRAVGRIMRELGRPGDDELAAAALLHDLGKIVLGEAHSGYAGWSAARGRPVTERLRAERRAFGLDHAALSALAVRRWGLPARVVDAVGDHHAPGADREGAIIALADALAHVAAGARPAGELESVAAGAGLSRAALRAAMLDLPADSASRAESAAPCPLTATELTVLRQIGEGRTVAQIAGERGVSVSTIRGHLHNAYRRLGVVDRTQAVLVARRRGWL